MSTILSSSDFHDELIKSVVVSDSTYLSGADEFIEDVIKSFDATKSISDIASPIPYKVKQLMICWVSKEVCMNKFGGQQGIYFKGETGEDRWYTKLKFYRKEFDDFFAEVTLDVITGESTKGRGIYSVPLKRC